ncbi:hypothetical protein J4727_19950 [Providencia rettgeri]|uniref:Uncharacterized protein n=1 Tax=Providencia rettgeri TaxID=587 RepID=A0A939SPM7_PRORE|nr:hypothetical protein [Providencia rettgeri]
MKLPLPVSCNGAGAKSAELVLISAVADAYHAQLLAQEQLLLAQQTLADWEHSLLLARQLRAAEQSSGLDVAQAEGQVASAEADLQARCVCLPYLTMLFSC